MTQKFFFLYMAMWVENYVHTTFQWMFITVLFKLPTLGNNQDVLQPMHKLWYVHTVDYYSSIKWNDLLSYQQTWKKHKCILLSERRQSEKARSCLMPIMWHSGKDKTMKIVNWSVVARDWEWGEAGWIGEA